MKLTALILLLVAAAASASTLVWDASPADEGVVKYGIYSEVPPATGFSKIDESLESTYTLAVKPITGTVFEVTAINDQGTESDPSDPVIFKAAPGKPIHLMLQGSISVIVNP